jgi:hypothetical protein
MNESSPFITATTVSSLLDWSRVCITLYVIESSCYIWYFRTTIASNLRTLCQVYMRYKLWGLERFHVWNQTPRKWESSLLSLLSPNPPFLTCAWTGSPSCCSTLRVFLRIYSINMDTTVYSCIPYFQWIVNYRVNGHMNDFLYWTGNYTICYSHALREKYAYGFFLVGFHFLSK